LNGVTRFGNNATSVHMPTKRTSHKRTRVTFWISRLRFASMCSCFLRSMKSSETGRKRKPQPRFFCQEGSRHLQFRSVQVITF
jgi:hypothetical protein